MGIINKNIKHLREGENLTQQEFGKLFSLTRGQIASYEEESEPRLDPLVKIVDYFNIDMKKFLTLDMSKENVYKQTYDDVANALGTVKDKVEDYAKSPSSFNPIVITVDKTGNETIPFVPNKARAGYLSGYGDPEFISSLPNYSIPGLNNGTYRAFQIDGWSMFKHDIREGLRPDDWIICHYVESPLHIIDDRVYCIVSQEEGIIVKRCLNRLANTDIPRIICMSDNKSGDYPHIIIQPNQVHQIWEFKMHLSRFINNPNDLYAKVTQIQGDSIILQEQFNVIRAEWKNLQNRLDEKGQ